MSGEGKRFKTAGYTIPKPLIKVHDKPIIEHVINLFPGEKDFLFICRNQHIEDYHIDIVLKSLKPAARVLGIEGNKLGPVYAVKQAFEWIKDEEPVVVSYCDYFMDWNWEDFKKTVGNNFCDGCVPVYTNFHPNLLPENNFYASVDVDESGWMKEIKEKYSFAEDKTKAFHSPGVYYFKSGAILKKYFQAVLNKNLSLNGEYYASAPYNLLVKDGLKVFVYNKIPHFCQWGTPEDLEEYNYWFNFLKKMNQNEIINKAKFRFVNFCNEDISRIIEYWKNFFQKYKF